MNTSDDNNNRNYPMRPWVTSFKMPFVDRLFEDLEKEFGIAIHPFRKNRNFIRRHLKHSLQTPQIDLIDENECYLLKADIPGYSKDNLDIELLPEEIRLSGEIETKEDKDETNYLYKERFHQKFSRIIPLPERIRVEEAKAEMKNGILIINLPKESPSQKETPTKLNID